MIEELELSRVMIDAAGEAIVALDRNGRIFQLNEPTARMFGCSSHELVGLPFETLLDEPDAIDLARLADSGAEAREMDVVARRKDGARFPAILSLSARHGRDETFLVAVLRDASQRHGLESHLVDERLRLLSSAIAHQLSNPLAALSANLDLAMRELASHARDPLARAASGDLTDELHDARESTERLRQAVDDLRLFSRAADRADLRRVVQAVLSISWNEIGRRARLVTDFGDTPPLAIDESRLAHAVLHLVLIGAGALSERPSEISTFRVVTKVRESCAALEVSAGPFDRRPSPTQILACRQRIEELSGEMILREDRGELTFEVRLPLREKVASSRTEASAVERSARRRRILVLDDEPMIASVVKRSLAREHDVITLRNGIDALARIVGGERFDVILCDLVMPEMSGMDFHSRLLSLAPEQASAIVFLSGDAFSQHVRAFLETVPNQHIEKPFDALQLWSVINDCIG